MGRLKTWALGRVVLGIVTLAAIAAVGVLTGTPNDALLVLFAGPPVVGWLLAARQPRRGIAVYAALLVLLAILLWWSQFRPGVLHPPPIEWALAFGLLGGILSVVAIVVERRPGNLGTPPGSGRTDWRRNGAVAVIASAFLLACACGGLKEGSPGTPPDPGWFEAHTRANTVRRLPPGVELTGQRCNPYGGDSCFVYFAVKATDGVSRAELIDRLVEHFQAQGWPLRAGYDGKALAGDGCRPMRGIIAWRDQCLRIYQDSLNVSDDSDTQADPDAVTLSLGSRVA